MKKIVYMAASLLLCMSIFSCSKDEIGGTSTESMAGDRYVTVDAVDANGEVVIEDFNWKKAFDERQYSMDGAFEDYAAVHRE